jgi:tetratricopeptide (TPR) repeat protein
MEEQLQKARRLFDLGCGAMASYHQSGNSIDLDNAIKKYRAALKVVPKCRESPTLQKCLTRLAQAYYYRFQADKKQFDIDQAVHYAEGALSVMKPETDRLRYLVLGNVATYLRARYEWTNDQRDLESTLDYSRQALRVAPEGHENRLECMQKVASALIGRYLQSGHLKDLKEAMRLEEGILCDAQEDDVKRTGYRSDYGTCFWLLFQRTLQRKHLDSAIQQTQKALAHAPDNDPDRYMYMRNLAVYCSEAFDRGRVSTDLSSALEHAEKACEAELTNGMQGSVWSCLAPIYALKFTKTREISDIDNAIFWARKTIALLPENHPKQTRHRSNLGVYHLYKYDNFATKEDFEIGLKLLREACFKTESQPLERLIACGQAMTCYKDHEDWRSAAEVADVALEVLPQIVFPTNTRVDMQHTIQQIDGVSGDIPSIMLKAGRSAAEALKALEESRNLIFNLTLDMNFDCMELRKRDQSLWQRYLNCQERVRRGQVSDRSTSDWEDSIDSYQRSHEELQHISDDVRKLPGMERFLLPLLEHEIRGLARNGFIVCFNAGQFGSEAFVITEATIDVVVLHDLTVEFIDAALEVIAIRGYRGPRVTPCTDSDTDEDTSDRASKVEAFRFKTVREMLDRLWFVAVKPVLDSLGLSPLGPFSRDLPHIYWAASGDMMLLPLHAAGRHDGDCIDNTMSYVVSSYATSLKVLRRSQQQVTDPDEASRPEILVVSMPTTPGDYKDLNSAKEAEAIVKGTRTWAHCNVLTRPSKQDVLNSLPASSIVHFACHGTAHRVQPDKSSLIVGKDEQESLSIGDLAKVSRPRSRIAYLSACSTAETRAFKMYYESIHLASTFQLIGFDNVVASLWAVDDDTAVTLATKFYDTVIDKDLNKESAVARRLHDALVVLREEMRHAATGVFDLTSWAPFVCYGN